MPNILTVVIPTRNRPIDLAKAVLSVREQTRLPEEFIILDQSTGNESRLQVDSLIARDERIRLVYIHDPSISGLVEAKRIAVERASGNIICFLDDDVVLEADYFEQIEQGFVEQPEMVGCCGILTNMHRQPFWYEFVFHLFHRGIFRDARVGRHVMFNGRGHSLIASNMLSGGVSAWRREVFSVVPFDITSGFHMLEDIDFSTRVAKHFGPWLNINPNARVEHHFLPLNREMLAPRQRRKMIEYILYYKKRRYWPWASFAMTWLHLGLLLESTFQSISARSLAPLRGHFAGILEGLAKSTTPDSCL
jgi:glycosyltransferase involved in cell wall biosynthesis